MKNTKLNNSIIIWLSLGIFLVSAMVILGGITRLTQSGLSIVEWKLIAGFFPPMNKKEWIEAFEKYKQFPEYKKINIGYNLADFKAIFWWEYIHRLLGKLIGIIFILPFIYFLIKKKLSKPLIKKLLFILSIGAFQGFIGWFMVKSGLVGMPHVSHYRLATHLIIAFFLFTYLFYLTLLLKDSTLSQTTTPYYQQTLYVLMIFIAIQILFGAFTAGLKGGLFYNTFPKMSGVWIPSIIGENYASIGLLSFFNTIASVQFIHRWLAIIIMLFIIAIGVLFIPSLNKKQKNAYWLLFSAINFQLIIGVFTLLYSVPLILAVLHQLGALLILMALVYAIHTSRSKLISIW